MQRIKISAIFIFTISLATSTGWHETFNTDVAADSISPENCRLIIRGIGGHGERVTQKSAPSFSNSFISSKDIISFTYNRNSLDVFLKFSTCSSIFQPW